MGLELDRGEARVGSGGSQGMWDLCLWCGGVELDWCWRWASDGGWGAVGVDEGYGT